MRAAAFRSRRGITQENQPDGDSDEECDRDGEARSDHFSARSRYPRANLDCEVTARQGRRSRYGPRRMMPAAGAVLRSPARGADARRHLRFAGLGRTQAQEAESLGVRTRRTLELPDRLTDHVEYQSAPRAFDLEFDLVTLHRLATQRAKPACSVPAPDLQRRRPGQLSLGDALARESAQFLFAVGL